MIVRIHLHIAIDRNGGFSVFRVPDGVDEKTHKATEKKQWPSWTHVYRTVELDLPLEPPAPEVQKPKQEKELWTSEQQHQSRSQMNLSGGDGPTKA